MSIEKLIEENTAALKELTATLIATTKLAPAASGNTGEGDDTKSDAKKTETKKTETKKTETKKASITQEQMKASLTELKDLTGSTEESVNIIKSVGKVAKMSDVPEAKYEAVYNAVKARIAEINEGGGEEEGEM